MPRTTRRVARGAAWCVLFTAAVTLPAADTSADPAPTAGSARTSPPAGPGHAADGPAAGARRPARRPAGTPLTERWHAVRRGGFARAANSAVTCRAAASRPLPCRSAQRTGPVGAAGVNSAYDMVYSDVDDDPNTYNSTRAALTLPARSRVVHARLYWGGNLVAGEVKPARDNGRVLIAEPGGAYKEVRADTVRQRRDPRGAYSAYQASADVTRLVAGSGAGHWTVAQINVAKGRSATGAWGGWSLVVAYENARSPRRRLTLWDGLVAPRGTDGGAVATDARAVVPAGAGGSAGLIAYDGDRGTGGESVTLAVGGHAPVPLRNAANPAGDVFNSTVTDRGVNVPGRSPGHRNTLGYDSDVLDLRPVTRTGGRGLYFRFTSATDDPLLGAVFAQTDTAPR